MTPTNMATFSWLKDTIGDILSKIDVDESNCIPQATSNETKERLCAIIRQLDTIGLPEQLRLVKSKLERMLIALDAIPTTDIVLEV